MIKNAEILYMVVKCGECGEKFTPTCVDYDLDYDCCNYEPGIELRFRCSKCNKITFTSSYISGQPRNLLI